MKSTESSAPVEEYAIGRKVTTLLLLVPLCLAVGQHSADSNSSREDSAVIGLENAWRQAELHHDMKATSAMLADSFFYVDAEGGLETRAEYVAGIGDKSYHPEELKNEDLKVVMYGNTALVTSAYLARGTEEGKHFAQRGRFVDVWIKLNGKWLCVSSQDTWISP